MLFNLELLENRELQELFLRECEQVLLALKKKNQPLISETYANLSAIVKEFRRREDESKR